MSVAYSPDGRHIISGNTDKTIRIWDAETRAPVCDPLKAHTGSVRSVVYSPDGYHIISGSRDCTIRLWDAGTGYPVGEPLKGHAGDVISVRPTLPMGSAPSLDPMTILSECGIPRLVLQLTIL